jgi:hypothetical protein
MQILSSFDGAHAELGVSEVAQLTGLHKATTHRIMMTLLNGGFLERAADGERFRLGLRVVELGLGALRGLDLLGQSHAQKLFHKDPGGTHIGCQEVDVVNAPQPDGTVGVAGGLAYKVASIAFFSATRSPI